ncbi:hypothetical protein DIPPA_07179 [Diplonema papillatum]|nr:hypothetical protein DIPPA_07179 [Diplonema papillatum]
MTGVGSQLQTKGCMKANNNNQHPQGAGYMKPRSANTIGTKVLPEANPPPTGTKGHHKEEMKHDQPSVSHEAELAKQQEEEHDLTKSEAKKERETKDRHESRQGFADHGHQKKHQMVQEELLTEAASPTDILDVLHKKDVREMAKKEAENDNENKTAYAEYEQQVQEKEQQVADLNDKKQERQVEAPQLKELKRDGDIDEDSYMKVQQQRNDFNNDCLNQSKNSAGGTPAVADVATSS